MRAIAASLALSSAAAAAWTCASPPALLTVDTATLSYSVAVAGVPWLTDGAVAARAGGTVFSSTASPSGGGLCSPIPNTDCVGDDLRNASQPSADACCAACSALPGCKAWSLQGAGAVRQCYLKSGCSNPTPVPDCVSGVQAPQGVLRPTGVRNVSGSDVGGAFAGLEVAWAGAAGDASLALVTTFQCYASGLLGFTSAWPSGAERTNATLPPAQGSPIVHFPSFASAGALGDSLRWIHVDGIWTLNEIWGTGTSRGLGLTDAPLTLFNASAPGPTLILSALDNFRATRVGVVADPSPPSGAPAPPPRLVAGQYSTITDVPPGHSSRVVLAPGAGGVSATTLAWGALLQAAYATTRLPTSRDVLNKKLSYWSDNGATLFQSYWDKHCPSRNCTAVSIPNGTTAESTFIALKDYHTQQKLPFALYQMDTWWFPQGADREPGGTLDCAEWVPREDLFPNGLPYLTQQGEGGIPLLLYSWGFVPPSKGNTMTNWTWITSYDGKEAMVALNETYAFYSMIRDRFLAYNGTSFEEDNTNGWGVFWDQTQTGHNASSVWWEGFATPWCEAGIPVQACECSASDVLETLRYGCVTSSRDTIDDVPGAGGNSNPLVPGGGSAAFFLHRWRVGQDRLLLGALGVRPFFDNTWSTMWQNTSTWAGFAEYYVELAWVLSVLSGGAVGVGDMPGNSNRTLIMTACREDGVLLGASLPSFYIDDVYRPAGSVPGLEPGTGRVYQAPSFIPTSPARARASALAQSQAGGYDASPLTRLCTPAAGSACSAGAGAGAGVEAYVSVLAIDIGGALALAPAQLLLPEGGAAAAYVAAPWARGLAATASACAAGAPAAACLAPFSAAAPLPLYTGVPPLNYTHDFELYSVSPLQASGWALVGELGKVVRVSPARFAYVAPAAGGLEFGVLGAPGEAVSVSVLAPPAAGSGGGGGGGGGAVAGSMLAVELSLPSGGSLTVTCSGQGAAAACAQR